jgi:L-lactate utilization protein LutB
MSEDQTSLQFRANSARAVDDDSLRAAMRNATDTFGARRAAAFEAIPDLESLREQASAIRLEVLAVLTHKPGAKSCAGCRGGI